MPKNRSTARLLTAAITAALTTPAIAGTATFRDGLANPFVNGVYQDTADATILAPSTPASPLSDNNYGLTTSLLVRNTASTRYRSLLRFDLSSLSGLGITVTDAILVLQKGANANTNDTASYTFNLHSIIPQNAGWVEGNKAGNGAPADAGEVTGNNRAAAGPGGSPAAIPWVNAAGTPVSLANAGAYTLLTSTAPVQYGPQPAATPYAFTGPELTAAVQSWIDAPADNAGLFINNSVASGLVTFYSSNFSNAARRPTLTLSLSSPTLSTTLSGTTGDVAWSDPANWSAGAPNSVGADATLPAASASRAVTVDSNQILSNLTLQGPHPYTLAGPGSLRLLEVNAGQATLTSTGSHTIATPLTLSSPTALTVANPADTLTLTAPLTIVTTVTKFGPGTLSLGAGATPSLLSTTGTLDLQTGALLLSYAGPAPLTELRAALAAGRLTTSLTPSTHSVGYTDDGAATLTLLRTLKGDANLDGQVNADDLALIDKGLATSASTWSLGDFNYDGAITDQDYLLIDTAYLQSHPASPTFLAERQSQFGPEYVSQLLTSIPEPSTAACFFAGLLLLSPHRPRRA